MGTVSLITAMKDGQWGCINQHNEVTVPFIYKDSPVRSPSSNPEENTVWFNDGTEKLAGYDIKGNRVYEK